MRRGFTLIEMLVASMVFILGFVSVFTLFLAGMKFRAQSDLDTRAAIALRNLVEEMQLDAGAEKNAPYPPKAYLGCGFAEPSAMQTVAGGNAGGTDSIDDQLFPCPGMPGLFYRVLESHDCTSGGLNDDPQATVLHLRVVIVGFAISADAQVTWRDLAKRSAIPQTGNLGQLIQELVRRGIATDNHVAIMRQPSWLRAVTGS
jgi:prepilin-type N-terminal cleavage/methylation domain-containing protein